MRPALILAHAFPPENLIGAYRPARFARYLPEHGFEPWVLTASEGAAQAPRILEVPFRYSPAELLLGKTMFPHDDRMTWIGRATKMATDWLRSFPQKPVLFSTSPPLASHIVAWRLAQAFNLAWVADFRDPVVANFGRRKPLGRFADAWIEAKAVRLADAILMNTEAAAEELRSRYPRQAAKISALPNGFDPGDGFGPLPLPLREKRVWLHGGSIYRNRYPERLFDGLWRLTQSGRLPLDWKIRMIGVIEDMSLLERPSVRALRERGAADITAEHLPQKEALREAAEADGTIVFDHYHDRGPNLAIPAKSFDCVRVGRPIIAFTSPRAPLDAMLAASGVPAVRIFEEDPPEAIEEKLLAYSQQQNQFTMYSESFRQAHSAPEQSASLARLFDRVLSAKGMLRS